MVALLVIADVGDTHMAIPLVKMVGRERFYIVVLGAAISSLEKAGILPDYNPEGARSLDPRVFIDSLRPRVIILGIGSPPGWPPVGDAPELAYLREANRLGIPSVVLETHPGGHNRLRGEQANVILGTDQAAGLLALRDRAAKRAVVVGWGAIKLDSPSEAAREFIVGLRSRFGAVYVWSSGRTADDLELAVNCMRETGGCLVPLPHPKVANEQYGETGETHLQIWDRMLKPLGSRVVTKPANVTSDDVAVLANGFLSGFSTMGVNTAYHGVPTGTLWTKDVQQSLLLQHGLAQPPVVSLGLSTLIEAPYRLSGLWWPHMGILEPYKPEIALAEIGKFI